MTLSLEKINNMAACLTVVGLLLLVAALPFHYGCTQRFALYWLAVTYPLDYVLNHRWSHWHWTPAKWIYVAFIAFFCLVPVWQLFDPIRTPLFDFTIEQYAPFLAVGLCGIAGITDKFRIDYAAWTMLGVSTAIVICLIVRTGLHHPDFAHWVLCFNINRAEHINTHMVVNLYFNLSLILGIFVVLYGKRSVIVRTITALCMVPAVFALLITEGRTGLLTFLLCTFVLLLHYMLVRHRWWMLSVVAAFVVLAGGIIMNNERLELIGKTTDPRIYIWKVAVETIMGKPVLGYGVCSAREEFVRRGLADKEFNEHYADHVRTFPKYTAQGRVHFEIMHPHNALLDTWMQFGVFGVFLLVICLILPSLMRLGKYQLFLDLCILAFVMQACFESLGNNLQPMYLCLIVLLFQNQYQSDVHLQKLKRQASEHPVVEITPTA